ncbi:hypothetical protein [Nostoc sp.]
MTFFNSSEPLLRENQQELDFQDIQGLVCLKVKLTNIVPNTSHRDNQSI